MLLHGTGMDDRLSARAWLWTVASCVGYLASTGVPVPGLDADVLRAMAGQSGGLLGLFDAAPPLVSVVSGGLGLLLLVRGVLRLLAGPAPMPERDARRARIGFALYAALSFLAGLAMAVWAEAAGTPFGEPVIAEPGWATRLLVAGTLAAGAAWVWFLATVISRRGVGLGPLVLFGLNALVSGASGLAMLGPDLQRLDWEPSVLLGRVGLLAAPVILLFAFHRFRPASWPLTVTRGLRVTSPIDLLPLPSLIAAILLAPAGATIAAMPSVGAVGAHGDLAHALVTVAAAVAVAVWLRKRAVGRGSPLWLLGALALVLLGLALAASSLLGSGAVTRALTPGPYEGEREVILELVAPGADGASDAPVLVRRFDELGLSAEVLSAGRGRIRLRVSDVGDVHAALEAILPQRAVSLRLVAVDQGPLRAEGEPPGPELAPGFEPDPVWRGPTRASLAPLRARLTAEQRANARVECDDSGCLFRLLEPGPAVVGPSDIADARVQLDAYEGRPNVALELTPAAAARFGDVTAASIGRLLAILVDDEIQSAPKIMDAIRGGRAQITLGGREPLEPLLAEANALAACLRAGPLGARWTLARER